MKSKTLSRINRRFLSKVENLLRGRNLRHQSRRPNRLGLNEGERGEQEEQEENSGVKEEEEQKEREENKGAGGEEEREGRRDL